MNRLLATALAVGLVAAAVVPAPAGHKARGRANRRGGVPVYSRFSYGILSPVVSPRFGRGYYASPTYFYQAPAVYSSPAVYQGVCPPACERPPAPPACGWPARERAWVPYGQPPAPGHPAIRSDANNLRETREEMP